MGRKSFITVIILILFFQWVKADEKKYPCDDIPEKLTKNSKVVVRELSKHLTISSINKGKMEVKEVYTILNNSGIRYSYFVEFYNKFLKIKNIKGKFYDKEGNELRKLKKNDLIDVPAIAGYSLYEDNRVIAYKPDIDIFPYTVEYTYTIEFDGFLSYPSWYIYPDYNVAVEKSQLTIAAPVNISIREYYQNLDLKPEISNNEHNLLYTWQVSEKESIDEEPFSSPFRSFCPALLLAPYNFEIGGYGGKMESWNDFGNWISDLNKDRNNLPQESKVKIAELVKDAKSDKEKIDILYKHLQNKTRYVNVAVGIGGWQPFETETVDRLSYGDCKALSFYMKSMLEVVGIKSYYTIVKAGADQSNIVSDFPMNQFNHAFLFIPMENDTMWLECTSQKTPTGYIGDFTDDRDVLIIDGKESKLVRTPSYKLDENIQYRNVEMQLDIKGGGDAIVVTQYHGLAADNLIHRVDQPYEDNKKRLYKQLEIKDFIINDFSYSYENKRIPDIYENINLRINNYGTAMGNRLIIPLNLMNRVDYIPKKQEERITNIVIKRDKCQIDSITYIIPGDFGIENIPEEQIIKTKFGKYETKCLVENNNITYYRKLDIYKGSYSPEEYDDFRNFIKNISKIDKNKMVLKKVI